LETVIWTRARSLLIGAWSAAAGTLIGFLVALSVYYIQAEQQNSVEESQSAATRARLITLLKSELSYDLQAINQKEGKTLPAAVNAIKLPLKFGFWRMISNSGDMKVMKDLDVIYALSGVYANIDNTDYWEHKYIDAMTGAASTVTHTNPDGGQMPYRSC
jgi:hypothetical protein